MKKFKRVSLALLLALIMLVQTVPAFAEVSPIVYEVADDGSIISYVFARNLTNKARLYTALYDENGDFVSAEKSGEADKAGYLKTTVKPGEGQNIKSFIWDKNTNPFAKAGEYEESINIDDITITLNGNDLRTYLAEDEELAFGGNVFVDIKDAGFETTPIVRAFSKDSQVDTFVEYSKDGFSAKVICVKGERILSEDAQTVTNDAGASFVAERYTNAVVETINIVLKKTWFSDEDLTSGSPNGAIIAYNNLGAHWQKTYNLAEDETVKKIALKFSNIPSQGGVIILKAVDSSDGKNVLVNSDGSAISWVDDNDAFTGTSVKSYDYTNNKVLEYTKVSKNAIKSDSGIVAAAVKELSYGDNKKQNATRALTDRSPVFAMQIYNATGSGTADLEGSNYICFESKAQTNVTLEFYVNKDVEIHVFGNGSFGTTSDVDGETVTQWASGCKTTATLMRRYQGSADVVSVAWLIRNGLASENDFTPQINQNVMYDLDGDGKRESWHDLNGNGKKDDDEEDALTGENIKNIYNRGEIPDIVTGTTKSGYFILQYDIINTLVKASGSDSGWGFDLGLGTNKKDIANSVLPYYYSNKYTWEDVYALWDDREFKAGVTPLVQDFEHVSVATVEDMPMQVVSGNHKGEKATYTGDIAISDNVKSKIIDFFGLTLTPDRTGLSLNSDGKLSNQQATGALKQYPDGFGIENSTYICFNNGLINDDGFWYGKDEAKWYPNKLASYADYWNTVGECYPWYSFKVARDAEVTVFSNGLIRYLESDPTWNKVGVLSTDDSLQIVRQMNSANYYTLNRVYTKKLKAGEIIEMKTPGYINVLYGVFVKEDNAAEIDCTLSSLTVGGKTFDNFDPKVTEYTYALSEEEAFSIKAPEIVAVANDSNATVKVLSPETFPGSSKVVVNHPNGGTKVYKINYTENYTYVTDVKSDLETVTTSPKFYKGGLVVGANGILATDRASSTSWRISEIPLTELEGNDTIIGAVDTLKGATTITFTLKRPAVMRVLLNSNGAPNVEKPLVAAGFVLDPDTNNAKLVGSIAGTTNVRYYPRMLTKTLAAGTHSIPYAKPDMPGVYALQYLPFE